MKSLLVVFTLLLGLSFVSCGNRVESNTQAGNDSDSVCVVDSDSISVDSLIK